MNSMQLQTEHDLSIEVSGILNDKARLFERLVKFMEYKSTGEFLRIQRLDEQKYLKNPELFFYSTLYTRQCKFLYEPKSFFAKIAFDLYKRQLFVSHFNSLLFLVTYESFNREFNPELPLRDKLIDRIKDYENLEERLKLDGLTVQHFISHLYRLLDSFKLTKSQKDDQYNQSSSSFNELNLQQFNITNNVNVSIVNVSPNNTNQPKRSLSDKVHIGNIEPFPIIKLGERGPFITAVGTALYQRRYIDNLELYRMLHQVKNDSIVQAEKIRWNSIELALIYFFVILLNHDVIARSERAEIPMYLERAFLYKRPNGRYHGVDSRNVHKRMNQIEKEGVKAWALSRRNGVYREIHKIVTEILAPE